MATNIAVPPVMPTPTARSAVLSIECIAGYLNSDPNKTAKALGNLAAGGYVIRVSSNPGRWVRVVPEEMVLAFGHMVPLSSVTFSSDSAEVTAPPEPSRPRRVLSPEVERRLAIYQGSSLVSVADIEREILLEKYEGDLAAGLIDDEESPF